MTLQFKLFWMDTGSTKLNGMIYYFLHSMGMKDFFLFFLSRAVSNFGQKEIRSINAKVLWNKHCFFCVWIEIKTRSNWPLTSTLQVTVSLEWSVIIVKTKPSTSAWNNSILIWFPSCVCHPLMIFRPLPFTHAQGCHCLTWPWWLKRHYLSNLIRFPKVDNKRVSGIYSIVRKLKWNRDDLLSHKADVVVYQRWHLRCSP